MYTKIKKVFVHEEDVETGELREKIIDVPQPLIRTPFTSQLFPKNYEVNTMPSLTVPDMTMTVKELMMRHAHGLPLDGGKIPMWEEEGDMPDIQKMDLAERQQVIEDAQEEITAIQKRVAERRREVEQKRLDDIVKARVEKKLEEQQQKGGIPNEEK